MTKIGFAQGPLAKYAGPGHWNDPDMLEVGNGGMTADEYRTHISLWALLAAPLLAGNDLSKMTPETKSILMNKAVIAIDQDKLGVQGDRVSQSGDLEVWSKPLGGGAVAVGLFNRGTSAAPMTLKLSDVGVKHAVHVSSLWEGANPIVANDEVSVSVPAHGVVLLRIEP